MKIKVIMCLGLCGILSVFSSCSQDEKPMNSIPLAKTTSFSPSEIQQAKNLAVSTSELSNMSEEVKQKRAAAIILSDYTILEDNQYKLDISEQDAQKLGVTPYLYETIKNEISSTNEAIQKILEKGDSIELCDVQAISKAYKKMNQIVPPLKP